MTKKKFALLNITGMILYPQLSNGATQLPYYGPDQQNCMINQPNTKEMMEIDSGYIASEDCSHIYVLPPQLGEIQVKRTSIKRNVKDDCKKYHEQLADFNKNYPTEKEPDYEEKLKTHQRNKELFQKVFKRSYENTVAGKASSIAGFKWNELIQEYVKRNPNSKSQFKAMPITQGILSMKLADREAINDNGIKIHVNSYDPPKNETPIKEETNNEYKFITMDSASFLMGQKTSIDMEMDFENSCNIANNAETVSATYTYIFPLQSKGIVKIQPDINAVKSAIKEKLATEKKESKSTEMIALFKKFNSFKIEINNGLYASQEDKAVIEQFKDDLFAKATEVALSSLASQQIIALAKAEYLKPVPHVEKTPIKFLGFKIGEIERHWTTFEKEIDWNKFEEELTKNLYLPSSEASNYTQFNLFNTSALIGK